MRKISKELYEVSSIWGRFFTVFCGRYCLDAVVYAEAVVYITFWFFPNFLFLVLALIREPSYQSWRIFEVDAGQRMTSFKSASRHLPSFCHLLIHRSVHFQAVHLSTLNIEVLEFHLDCCVLILTEHDLRLQHRIHVVRKTVFKNVAPTECRSKILKSSSNSSFRSRIVRNGSSSTQKHVLTWSCHWHCF